MLIQTLTLVASEAESEGDFPNAYVVGGGALLILLLLLYIVTRFDQDR